MVKNFKGAEAVVSFSKLLGKKVIIKNRVIKKYRAKELDLNLRKIRTRIEARLLHKSKLAGVLCPTVLSVDDFSIIMTYVAGKRPTSSNQKIFRIAGQYLAKLHNANIIHGDYTPANLLVCKNSGKNKQSDPLYVIDFGLGFFSTDIEDKAVDVLTMLKAINEKCGKAFLLGYKLHSKYRQVMQRIEQVKSRVRYA